MAEFDVWSKASIGILITYLFYCQNTLIGTSQYLKI